MRKKIYKKTFWNTEFQDVRSSEQKVVRKVAKLMLFASKEIGAHGNLSDSLERVVNDWLRNFCNEEERARFKTEYLKESE